MKIKPLAVLLGMVMAFATSAQATDYTWVGGTGNWNDANWNPGSVAGPTTAGNTAAITNGNVTVNLHGPNNVDSITLGSGAQLNLYNGDSGIYDYDFFGNIILQGGTLNGGSATYHAYGASAITALTVSGSSPSTLSCSSWFNMGYPSTTFNVADATGDANPDLTVTGTLEGAVDGGNDNNTLNSLLIKSGAGTMKLAAISYCGGGTTVNQGTLELNGASGGYGLILGQVTVNSGATLSLTGGDGTGFGWQTGYKPASLTISDGTVTTTVGCHVWNWSGGLNMTGGTFSGNGGVSDPNGSAFEWNNVSVTTSASANTATIAGRIQIRGDGGYTGIPFTVADGAAATDLLVSAAITEAGIGLGITKSGAGTMVLSGANTYTGPTTVNQGTLSIQGGNGAAGGTINKNSAVAINSGGTLSVDSVNAIGGYNSGNAPAITINAGGTMTSANGVTANINQINLAGGTVTSGTPDPTWGSWTLNGNVHVTTNSIWSAVNTYSGSGTSFNVDGGVTLTASGNFTNINGGSVIGSLTKTGNGTMTLIGMNGYTGNTTISAGTLALSGSGSLASLNMAIAPSASFDVSAVTPGSYALPAGALTIGIDKTSGVRSQGQIVIAGKNLTYAGALTVSKTGADALANGDSFTLVSKTSGALSGWFSSVSLPPLGSGLSWDTNNLATTGVLDVYTFTTTTLAFPTLKNTAAVISALKMGAQASSARGTPVAVSASTPANGTAVVSAGALTYTPATDFVGSDTFTVTYADGHGTQTMTVNVTVNSQNVGPQITPQNVGGYGSFTASGMMNQGYTIQISTKLPTWTDYANVTSTANGVIQFNDSVSISGHGGTVFYRLKQ